MSSGTSQDGARARVKRGGLLVAALTVPAILIATQLYFGYRIRGLRVPFAAALATQLCHWQLWAVAGPLVWRLERRWPFVPAHRAKALLRHAAAAPLVASAVLFLYWASYHTLIRLPVVSPWFAGFDRAPVSSAVFFVVAYFHVELVIYGGIVAVAHAVRTTALLRAREHETLRLEADLARAKLTALRVQLQPHFLFNTLHTIGSLVLQRETDRAVALLSELGELLRGTLAHRETELVPLREEIAYLRRYLRIEEARFGDRVTVHWEIDPVAEEALIPPFILQPIVENAFRHGISRRIDESVLRITATTEQGSVRVTVYNDGPALAEAFALDRASGYGLKNVRDRLVNRNPAGRLELTNAPPGVRATLLLPPWDVSVARRAE